MTSKHPNLERLEELAATLSYPGWEEDIKNEERMHRIFPLATFEKYLFRLEEKQRVHKGDRSHERLIKLDSQKWTYPEWQKDFEKAQEYHVSNKKGRFFDRVLKEMIQKQCRFDSYWSLHHHHQHSSSQPTQSRAVPLVQMLKSSPPMKTVGSTNFVTAAAAIGITPSSMCVICLSAPRSHIFIPCGHLCACMTCATQAFDRSHDCPICRKSSTTVTRVYLS